ncbi:hypothetical protein GCM10010910_30020 [Microbacterium nanhaiense]|uniref:Uncharacterized protein n=1 Tax=Microbacterium nanhaiense TaxID=1301026 RepID=A0ABQ2N5Q1_9MICO|nr:hypothetical protein GCM10010910_30020 [Microbacterium nanhaiense]
MLKILVTFSQAADVGGVVTVASNSTEINLPMTRAGSPAIGSLDLGHDGEAHVLTRGSASTVEHVALE